MNIDWSKVDNNIKSFSLDGIKTVGKVVSVYDGDTIKIVFPVHNNLYKWNCRLNGIDTPELRTKNNNEKEYGYKVRDELRKKILNKVVNVECGKFDKYGRLLVTVYNNEENINKWLVDNKYAFKYDGGTKKDWCTYLNSINVIL